MFNSKRNVLLVLAVFAVAGVAFGQPSENATVIKPTGATASDAWSGSPVSLIIDDSGLSATLDTGADGAEVSPVSHSGYVGEPYTGCDTGSTGIDEWFQVDLGSEMDMIEGLWIWNGISTGTSGDSAATVQVEVADGSESYADMGVFDLTQVAANASSYADYLKFSSLQDSVQYIKVTIKTTNDDGSGTYSGLREIRVSQVPEPLTMSLLAVGGLALLRRRRA